MSAQNKPSRGYWGAYGAALAERGYRVVLIKPGRKFPTMRGWPQRGVPTQVQIAVWALNPANGIGIVLGPRVHLRHSSGSSGWPRPTAAFG